MVSTVRSRPNHYETLGLTPDASEQEILAAFAREMGLFRARPMAAAAQVGIAYETLRNPVKRRAYDASLGLGPEADRPQPAKSARKGEPFIGSAPADPRPAAEGKKQPRPNALPERGLGSFIAESLREPARPVERDDFPDPGPQPEPPPWPQAEPGVGGHLADFLALQRFGEDGARGARPAAWQRTAIAAGGLVIAAGLVGAFAGWSGGGSADAPQPAGPDLTVPLPTAKPLAETVTPPPAAVEAEPRRPVEVASAQREPPAPGRPPAVEELQAEAGQSADNPPERVPGEQAVAEVPPAATVAAALPLPEATIARTIERIGYACGEVVSAEAVEGAGTGVFKVTCTSGQSYRATPVRGRYHFRPWDRR